MYNPCVQPCIDRALQRMLQTQPGTTLYEAPADVHWGCFVKLPTKLPVTIWPEFCQLCIYISVYTYVFKYIYMQLYPKSFPTCSMRLEYLPSHLAWLYLWGPINGWVNLPFVPLPARWVRYMLALHLELPLRWRHWSSSKLFVSKCVFFSSLFFAYWSTVFVPCLIMFHS